MNWYDIMTVDVPEGEIDGLKIQRFEIKPGVGLMRIAFSGRGTQPGIYTKMTEGSIFWMSDTQAEKSDHMEAVMRAADVKAERILVNGLGLGMVLCAFLAMDHVRHIDVVEKDERVIKLVGPHYEAKAQGRITIHHADAYEQMSRWPKGARWDIGWSDIWPDPSTDDLKDMAKLNRSYGRRCGWHGCWYQDELQRSVRAERRHEAVWND